MRRNKNQVIKYDIIIVGAGVSGLMLADYLDKTDLHVLLLEKKKKIDIHPRSFGTFTETVKKHKLEKYVDKYFNTWAFYGPTTKAAKTKKKVMCLVNFQTFAQSRKFKNAVVKTGVILKKAKQMTGGIQLIDDKKQIYEGRVVVDSSGYAQVVQKLLGLPLREQTGRSYEVELSNCRFPMDDEASFILNFNASNSGGWLYTFSKTKGQYGWADFYPESDASLSDLKKRTEAAMHHVFPTVSWMKKATITYSFGRFGPSGNRKHNVYDNLIAIGDAGGCGTPVTLEGFREAVDSAFMAYKTIMQSRTYSKEELNQFLALFNKQYGKYYRMHHIIRYIYLHWSRNSEIDRWISNFNRLSKKDFFKLIKGEATLPLMLKTLDIVLFANIFLNMINNILPGFLCFREKITLSKKEVLNETG